MRAIEEAFLQISAERSEAYDRMCALCAQNAAFEEIEAAFHKLTLLLAGEMKVRLQRIELEASPQMRITLKRQIVVSYKRKIQDLTILINRTVHGGSATENFES